MTSICLHPVDRIAVTFIEEKTIDTVQRLKTRARCTKCGSVLPLIEPNAQKAVDLAFAGLGKEDPEHEQDITIRNV